MDPRGDRSKGVTATTATLPATATSALDFDALYREARDDVFAYAATLLRDGAAAEDVTAQAFERAYRRRSRFDARRGSPRAWLFGIVRNAALDELRRRKRAATAEMPEPHSRARPRRGGGARRGARRRPRRARPLAAARPRGDRAQVPRRALQRRARRRPRRQPDQRGHAPAPRHDQAPGGRRCLISRCSSATSAPPPTRPGRRSSTPASPPASPSPPPRWKTAADRVPRPLPRARRRRDRRVRARWRVVVVGIATIRRRRATTPAAVGRRRDARVGEAPREIGRGLRAAATRTAPEALQQPRVADAAPRRSSASRAPCQQRHAHALHDARPGETVTDRAIRVVDGLGGYVQTSEVNSSGNSASATLTLKIPSDKLDAGIAQLSKLAHVKSRSQQDQDVTDQREALEAAVRDARADRAGLRVRLAKATTDKERSRLRAQLDRATPPRHAAPAQRRRARRGRLVRHRRAARRRRPPLRRRRASRRPLDARATPSATPCACSRSSPACS